MLAARRYGKKIVVPLIVLCLLTYHVETEGCV